MWVLTGCPGGATLRGSAPVAQLDRASVYGTEGQRFESSRARVESPATARLFCCRGQVPRTKGWAHPEIEWAFAGPLGPTSLSLGGRLLGDRRVGSGTPRQGRRRRYL